jgi:uncharacterized coiled-coil protein SlyX
MSDTPDPKPPDAITLTFLKAWAPAAVAVFVAGAGWADARARVTTLEAKVATQSETILRAAIEAREEKSELNRRLGRIEKLLAELVCTSVPQDPARCRQAMSAIGE